MANNYTVSTLLATAQVSTTFTDDDFVPSNYAWADPALIVTPDTGYVVSAENFTIGGSTPSATTTNPYTATFTHGVGGCTLPNSHITAVTFKNSSVAGSIGNVVVCELTTITGNFSGTPGATTALQVDIDGSAECAGHGFNFYDEYFDYHETLQACQADSTRFVWTTISANPACTTCTVGPLDLTGNAPYKRHAVYGTCCPEEQVFVYSRTFTCEPGYYFLSTPHASFVSNSPNSYFVVESITATDPTHGFTTEVKKDVYFTCQSQALPLSAGDKVFWKGPSTAPIPSGTTYEIQSCGWHWNSQEGPVIVGGTSLGLVVGCTPGASFDVEVKNQLTNETYDFGLDAFTAPYTKYVGAIPTLPVNGASYWNWNINFPINGTAYYYEVEITPKSGTIICGTCNTSCPIVTVMPAVAPRLSGTASNTGVPTNNSFAISASDTDLNSFNACQKVTDTTGTTYSGNITNTTIKTPSASTALNRLTVDSTVAISVGATMAATGIAAGTKVSSIISSTIIECNQNHDLEAGEEDFPAVTFTNVMGVIRMPEAGDWTNNYGTNATVLSRVGRPGQYPAKYAVTIPSTEIAKITPSAYAIVGGSGVPFGTYVSAKSVDGDTTVLTLSNTSGTNPSVNLNSGDIISITNSSNGLVGFENFTLDGLTTPQVGQGQGSIAFSCLAKVIKSPCAGNHVLSLEPKNFLVPYQKPVMSAITESCPNSGTITIKPLDNITDETIADRTFFALGGVENCTLAVTGTSAGLAAVVNNREIVYSATGAKGAASGTATITYTIIDGYNTSSTGQTITVNISPA